jgi:hypothetical protein
LVRAIETSFDTPGFDIATITDDNGSLRFSQQDFTIVLRQALMNVFNHQHFVQFITPLTFDNQSNGFIPFQVNGNSCAVSKFGEFLVPVLIKENIASLRARAWIFDKSSPSKRSVAIPVLGRYAADTLPEFQYKSRSDGNYKPLFSSLPVPQQTVDLINGSLGGSSSAFVDLNNAYYKTTLGNYNYTIEKLAMVSSPTVNIASADAGPIGLGTLFTTTIVRYTPEQSLSTEGAAQSMQALMYGNSVRNFVPVKVSRAYSLKKNEKERDATREQVTFLPAASLSGIQAIATTSTFKLTAEFKNLIATLIVPTVRLDSDQNDILSSEMYKIEVREPHCIEEASDLGPGNYSMFTRLCHLGNICVPGMAKQYSNEYDRILQALSAEGHAGMLAGLLGGLAKNLLPPELHNIVDTVAGVVPF